MVPPQLNSRLGFINPELTLMPNGLISKMEAVCQVVILMTYDSDILGVVMQICQYSSPHDLGNVHI